MGEVPAIKRTAFRSSFFRSRSSRFLLKSGIPYVANKAPSCKFLT